MNYLAKMTDDEIQYICRVVPFEDIQGYFRYNSKQFAKIRPGFRVTSVKRDNAAKILYSARSTHFIASFLEKHISTWLSEIESHLSLCIQNGESLELAYAHTLPNSFFAENYSLFFKLTGLEKNEDYISLLKALVLSVSKSQNDHQEDFVQTKDTDASLDAGEHTQMIAMLTEWLSEKERECAALVSEVQQARTLRIALSSEKSLSQLLIDDNEALSNRVDAAEKALAVKEKELELLEDRLADTTQELHELEIRIAAITQEKDDIESVVHETKVQEQVYNTFITRERLHSQCPEKIEEFKEYLGYNLQNIGVPVADGYFDLLIDSLTSILFCGMPILVNSAVGNNIAQCVANALIGTADIDILPFTEHTSSEVIKYFLDHTGRIVLLDGFVGNFDEMQFLPIISQYKNKIIFLTFSYEKTLRYIPTDFLVYCQYFNVNRIGVLLTPQGLTEDPSIFSESVVPCGNAVIENRFQKIGREIMRECGFSKKMIERVCTQLKNEEELSQVLVFSVLPYCADVLETCPYNLSRRLQKYAGQAGRCPYKNLIMRWFESE